MSWVSHNIRETILTHHLIAFFAPMTSVMLFHNFVACTASLRCSERLKRFRMAYNQDCFTAVIVRFARAISEVVHVLVGPTIHDNECVGSHIFTSMIPSLSYLTPCINFVLAWVEEQVGLLAAIHVIVQPHYCGSEWCSPVVETVCNSRSTKALRHGAAGGGNV